MPSLTYGVRFGTPQSRSALVSFSVNSSSGAPSQASQYVAEVVVRRLRLDGSAGRRIWRAAAGRRRRVPQDQVLRNQSVGRRWSGAASGPRLVARDADQDVVGRGLGVLDRDVEVAILGEDAGVEQLVLGLRPCRAARFSATSSAYGKARCGYLYSTFHVRVRRRGVEVEVVLLDVLAVVALGAGQAEQPLLEDRVAPVPERQREAEPPLVVGDAEQAVLAPAVGARAGVVVREVVPGRAVWRVVLAHGAPLALGQVRPPAPPGRGALALLDQSLAFGGRC